jgi:hypothetical protein
VGGKGLHLIRFGMVTGSCQILEWRTKLANLIFKKLNFRMRGNDGIPRQAQNHEAGFGANQYRGIFTLFVCCWFFRYPAGRLVEDELSHILL